MDLSKLRARSATRKLAGVDIPRQNRTSVAFRKAAAADGGDHDGITGGSSHRMCRARGGRVKRQDGGGTRISEDSKREVERIEKEDMPRSIGNTKALSAGLGIGTALAKGMPRPVKALGALVAGASAYGLGKDYKNMNAAVREKHRILRGEAKPGEEDRKSGGPVKRADGGGNWIAGATQNKGALHRALKVPMGDKIPAAKLDKAAGSDNPTMRKRAALAKTLKGLNK